MKTNLRILPEVKMPKDNEFADAELHPFWLIRRAPVPQTGDDDTNCELVTTDLANMVSGEFESLKSANFTLPPHVSTSKVTLPCIRNTKRIAKSTEVVLKVPRVEAPPKAPVSQKRTNAYDALVASSKKQKH